MNTDNLDEFVRFVDKKYGGVLSHPDVQKEWMSSRLQCRTRVNESINPFSDAYFQAQVRLYNEISGRELDQESGELHPVDVPGLVGSPNPLGYTDVGHMSNTVRALSAMLSLACLPSDAKILDLGAGHGVSSEIYAFCGARVHAVDIDPDLSTLAIARAEKRGLRISRSLLNFDDILAVDGNSYDAAFFYQSLHHCLKPWNLIRKLRLKMVEGGVIGFCGEPIQNQWWRHWGLRLDLESVYMARKFGWFESGWSVEFIHECFRRNGMQLVLFDGGFRGGQIGLASADCERLTLILDNAAALGFNVVSRNSKNCSFVSEPDKGSGKHGDCLIDFKQSKWPGILRDVQGLYHAEPWGTWSSGKMVTLEFSETLPEHFAITLVANTFGPNIGAEFLIYAGTDGKRFALNESYEKRVFEFSSLEQISEIRIVIPNPVSPKSIGVNEDARCVGIGLVELSVVSL